MSTTNFIGLEKFDPPICPDLEGNRILVNIVVSTIPLPSAPDACIFHSIPLKNNNNKVLVATL